VGCLLEGDRIQSADHPSHTRIAASPVEPCIKAVFVNHHAYGSLSLMMGGGPEPTPEHLLFILPFPEPTEILERIKKNHPHIDITYRNLSFVNFEDGMKEIPKGSVLSSEIPQQANRYGVPLVPLPTNVLDDLSELFQKVTFLCTLTALPKSPEDAPKLGMLAAYVDIQ